MQTSASSVSSEPCGSWIRSGLSTCGGGEDGPG